MSSRKKKRKYPGDAEQDSIKNSAAGNARENNASVVIADGKNDASRKAIPVARENENIDKTREFPALKPDKLRQLSEQQAAKAAAQEKDNNADADNKQNKPQRSSSGDAQEKQQKPEEPQSSDKNRSSHNNKKKRNRHRDHQPVNNAEKPENEMKQEKQDRQNIAEKPEKSVKQQKPEASESSSRAENEKSAGKPKKKPKPQKEEQQLPEEKETPDISEELAEEAEPDTAPKKSGIKAFFSKLKEIITAPEDGDLSYGDEASFEDIFMDDEVEEIKPESKPEPKGQGISPGKKRELPKTLRSSSLYAESKQPVKKEKPAPAAKPEKKEKPQPQPEVPAVTEAASVPGEPEEHIPITVREGRDKKEAAPIPENQKKPRNKKAGQSEITVDEIIKAKNSVPQRSAKAYGALDTADKDIREKETEIPIFVNHKNQNGNSRQGNAQGRQSSRDSFDLEQLSQDQPIVSMKKPLPQMSQQPAKAQKPGELSHDVPRKPEQPAKAQKPSELAHDAPAAPKANEAVNAGEGRRKAETADSLPGGQGVRIEPWTPKKKTETIKRERPDLRSDGVVYRSNEASPFVVMAGKFTRTLKNEYDNTRRIRETMPKDPPPPAPPAAPETAAQGKNEAPGTAESDAPGAPKKAKRKAEAKKKAEQPETNGKITDLDKIKKKKAKFSISDIFNYEGDRFDDEEDEEPVKTELTDYSSEEDAEEIRGDINENFRRVFVRTIVLTCTCIASVTAAVIAKWMPWLFLNMMKSGWLIYSGLMFVLYVVSIFVARYPIANGFMPLRKLRGNSDTPVSIAALAVGIQSIIALFMPNVFLDETYHIYVPLLILSLLLNSMGKLLIIRRTADNFRFLCSKDARFAGKIYTNAENADRFVNGLPSRKPLIAYSKRSKFMSNFLQLSYAPDPVEELSAFFAPIAGGLSLVCAAAYGILTKDFASGVSSYALSACITIPMCSLLAINIPMLNLCTSANKSGAMVVGYEAVKQFCDTNTIMLDSSDLYPKGSIVLSGMKTINESKLQEAISAGAAMTFAVNGPLTHVFETIVRQSKYKLPDLESVSYDDEMGLSGWSNGNRILIGRRELFEKHNIRLPDESVETKYRKRGNEIAYISVGGELAVMFILTYKADRAIAQSLRSLEDSGVCFVIRTIDPNITQQHVAEKFSLYPKCIKILPTGLGMICHDELSAKEKTSRAYLVTNGKLSSFANAVSGCIRIKSTVTIAKIVQYLAIIIGFILVTIISFISGFAKLGSFELLVYTGFWCAALIAVSIGARRLS